MKTKATKTKKPAAGKPVAAKPVAKPKPAARKPTAKVAPKPEPPKVDVKTLEVTQTELAYCLGITTANITGFIQTGLMHKTKGGRMPLMESVSSYCRSLRERKSGDSKSDLELENIALKNEKLKEGLRSWRMQRDREVAMAILDAQRNAMQRLRDECKLVPNLVQVIDEFLGVIDRIDIEQISYTVEGETEEDDE